MNIYEFGNKENPVIHEHDMRHEELLGVYPEDWCSLVEKICL